MSNPSPLPTSPVRRASPFVAILLGAALLVTTAPPGVRGDTPPDHLVVSEIVTGGASASDEMIELHNPTAASLPLEGLELVYVTASGATVSRRAAWSLGAPEVGAGRHVLVANEGGIYAGIADATYVSGMAATGGSVALRILGASSAIDAVGWGTATSTWREGPPAPVAAAGASIERLPGGTQGSTRDTDDNAGDFVVRDVPDPQNLGAPPTPDPLATPTPAATATPAPTVAPPTAEPTVVPTAEPTPDDHVTVATARALPDGTLATIEGVAVTGSDFADGGGFVADESGGIAVLVDGGGYERGVRLRLVGTLDDRFAQRTLRVAATDVTVLGTGSDPTAAPVSTGAVDESVEGRLVRIAGAIAGAPTVLTSGAAYDVDDGSGPVRVLVGPTTEIALASWTAGTNVTLVGVVGQRDSSGTGAAGYRIQPRDPADILAVTPGAEPTATPSPAIGSPSPSATAEPAGVVTIAAARELPKNSRVRVRGTVTMPTGIVDDVTAVIQDATGAIVLRLGDEAGTLTAGRAVEVDGTRSTKSGMETLRVTMPPRDVGAAAEPSPRLVRTGEVGEPMEALLVTVRGGLVASARRASSGSVSFEIDDGSGPLRIAVDAALALDDTAYVAGAWVEVRGVVGQETSGSQPLRGYRVWPRAASDLRVMASPSEGTGSSGAEPGSGIPGGSERGGSALGGLDTVGQPGTGDLVVGATLVAGPWPELGIGGLLWDGTRLVAIAEVDADRVAAATDGAWPPAAVELVGLRAAGDGPLGLPLVSLASGAHGMTVAAGPPAAPAALLPAPGATSPRWVAVVGRRVGTQSEPVLVVGRARIDADRRCDDAPPWPTGTLAIRGIAAGGAEPAIVIGCQGVVPAPHLGAVLPTAGAEAAPAAHAAGVATPDDPGTSWAPGVLLGLAAGALAAAAALVRRAAERPDQGPDGTFESGNLTDEETPSVPASAGPPVLTLVSLPRERAP